MTAKCWEPRPPLFREDEPSEGERPRLPEPSPPASLPKRPPESPWGYSTGKPQVSNGNGGVA